MTEVFKGFLFLDLCQSVPLCLQLGAAAYSQLLCECFAVFPQGDLQWYQYAGDTAVYVWDEPKMAANAINAVFVFEEHLREIAVKYQISLFFKAGISQGQVVQTSFNGQLLFHGNAPNKAARLANLLPMETLRTDETVMPFVDTRCWDCVATLQDLKGYLQPQMTYVIFRKN